MSAELTQRTRCKSLVSPPEPHHSYGQPPAATRSSVDTIPVAGLDPACADFGLLLEPRHRRHVPSREFIGPRLRVTLSAGLYRSPIHLIGMRVRTGSRPSGEPVYTCDRGGLHGWHGRWFEDLSRWET
jgi:hypothetical protein